MKACRSTPHYSKKFSYWEYGVDFRSENFGSESCSFQDDYNKLVQNGHLLLLGIESTLYLFHVRPGQIVITSWKHIASKEKEKKKSLKLAEGIFFFPQGFLGDTSNTLFAILLQPRAFQDEAGTCKENGRAHNVLIIPADCGKSASPVPPLQLMDPAQWLPEVGTLERQGLLVGWWGPWPMKCLGWEKLLGHWPHVRFPPKVVNGTCQNLHFELVFSEQHVCSLGALCP